VLIIGDSYFPAAVGEIVRELRRLSGANYQHRSVGGAKMAAITVGGLNRHFDSKAASRRPLDTTPELPSSRCIAPVNAFLVSLLPWPTSEQSAATGQPCSNENGSEGAGCRTCPANDRKPKRRTDLHGHSAGLPFSRQSRRGRVRFAEIR